MNMLTKKQEDFAFNVAVKGMNYTDAYRQANYAVDKLTDNTLWVAASRLKDNSKVALRIEALRDEIEGPDKMSRAEMINRLTSIGRANLADHVDEHGQPVLNKKEPSQVVAEYEVKAGKYGYNKSIKLHDPLQAMRDIAKLKGYWQPDNIVNQDNRVINIIVMDQRTKELMSRVHERTGKLIEGEVIDEPI